MPATSRWTPATRAAFRFAVIYVGLFSAATQIVGGVLLLPNAALPSLGVVWPLRELTAWAAVRMFGARGSLTYTGNSGDTVFFWVQTAVLVGVALLGAAAWSLLDNRRRHYNRLHEGLQLFLRLALAAQMLNYGMAKVIPTQFPAPSLVTLVEPAGHLSLTGMLWTSIGASVGYQMFTGWAEILAAALLVVPRTAVLGALVCLVDMVAVLVLNLTYDIGLKIVAAHLTAMTALLLLPDVSRLLDAALGRAVPPVPEGSALFPSPRARRIALVAQVALGVYLAGVYASINWTRWKVEGGGSPRSALYGIWRVESLSVDGQTGDVERNDYDRRWRRVIFDEADSMVVQRTDDSFAHYGALVNAGAGTLTLSKGHSRSWRSALTFMKPSPDRLVLDGAMDDHQIHARFSRVDLDTFRLVNGGFRWVRPPD